MSDEENMNVMVLRMARQPPARRRVPATETFEEYLARQLADPGFRDGYERAGAAIRSSVELTRALDVLREQLGMSKAEVARRMGRKPEAVSRLLRSDSSNPTLETLVELIAALDLQLELRIARRPRNASRDQPHVTVSARL